MTLAAVAVAVVRQERVVAVVVVALVARVVVAVAIAKQMPHHKTKHPH